MGDLIAATDSAAQASAILAETGHRGTAASPQPGPDGSPATARVCGLPR